MLKNPTFACSIMQPFSVIARNFAGQSNCHSGHCRAMLTFQTEQTTQLQMKMI
jgi:hypothetical protein